MNDVILRKTVNHSNHLLFTEDILKHYSIHSSKELREINNMIFIL